MPQIAANPQPVVNVQVPVPVPTPVPPARRQPRPAAPPPPPTGSRPRRPTGSAGGAVYILPHTPEPPQRLGRKRRYSQHPDVQAMLAAVQEEPDNLLHHLALADALEDAGHSAAARVVRRVNSDDGGGHEFDMDQPAPHETGEGGHMLYLHTFGDSPDLADDTRVRYTARLPNGLNAHWWTDHLTVDELDDLAATAAEEGTPGNARHFIATLHGLDQPDRGPPAPRDRYSRLAALVRRFARPVAPSKDTPSEGDYLYHATNTERLADIAADGFMRTFRPWHGTDQRVWPDGETERRSYWSRNAGNVWMFAPEDGEPVIVRTPAGPHFKRESTGDFYTTKRVPADRLEVLTNDGWVAVPDHHKPRPMGRRHQLLHRLARSLGEQNVQPANTGGGRRRYSREDHEAFQSGILSKYDGRAGWRAKDEAAGHTDPLLPLAYADWLDDHDHPAGKVIRWAMQPDRRQLLRQMGQRGMFTGWAADPPDEGGISYSTGVGARVRQHPTHPIILSADFQHGEGDGKRYGRFFAPVTPDEAREVADQIEARLPGHKTAADMRALADRFDRRPRQNARRRYSAPFDRHAAASALAAAGKPAHAAMLRSAARIGPPAADGHAVSVGRVSSTGDALVRLHLPAGSHGPAATVERTVRPLQAAILRLALRREGAADDAWGDHSTLPPARGVA